MKIIMNDIIHLQTIDNAETHNAMMEDITLQAELEELYQEAVNAANNANNELESEL